MSDFEKLMASCPEQKVYDMINKVNDLIERNPTMKPEQKKFYTDIVDILFISSVWRSNINFHQQNHLHYKMMNEVCEKRIQSLESQLQRYITIEEMAIDETFQMYKNSFLNKIANLKNNRSNGGQ